MAERRARSMVIALQQEADGGARAGVPVPHVSRTGSIASLPASGSRRMLEKKPEAALFGLPGRMQMVGSLMPMPSKKPRRE